MTGMLTLTGRVTELADGLKVRRVLPAAQKRAVGPFVFFDHFGPVSLPPEADSDVGGHPHIGLATVSYLFEGSLLHRDSLGSVQLIEPGAVNWMTAGRGIVHSERTPQAQRGQPRRLHGLQLWVALPAALEETEPSFQHVSAAALPVLRLDQGIELRILVGQSFGQTSPVRALSETLYLDLQLPPGASWKLPVLAQEMALYSPQHSLTLNGQTIGSQQMVVLPGGQGATLQAGAEGARLVVIGGAPLEQPVRMWWNFVSVDRNRLAQAARRWEAGGFDAIPGEAQRVAAPKWVG